MQIIWSVLNLSLTTLYFSSAPQQATPEFESVLHTPVSGNEFNFRAASNLQKSAATTERTCSITGSHQERRSPAVTFSYLIHKKSFSFAWVQLLHVDAPPQLWNIGTMTASAGNTFNCAIEVHLYFNEKDRSGMRRYWNDFCRRSSKRFLTLCWSPVMVSLIPIQISPDLESGKTDNLSSRINCLI